MSCHAATGLPVYQLDVQTDLARYMRQFLSKGFFKYSTRGARWYWWEALLIRNSFPRFRKDNRRENVVFSRETLRPQCLYEASPGFTPYFLVLMLIFSYAVLATIPLIVGASGGASSHSAGIIFEGSLSRFGPQASRLLQSRQTLEVPPDCVVVCDTFQYTIQVGYPSNYRQPHQLARGVYIIG